MSDKPTIAQIEKFIDDGGTDLAEMGKPKIHNLEDVLVTTEPMRDAAEKQVQEALAEMEHLGYMETGQDEKGDVYWLVTSACKKHKFRAYDDESGFWLMNVLNSHEANNVVISGQPLETVSVNIDGLAQLIVDGLSDSIGEENASRMVENLKIVIKSG